MKATAGPILVLFARAPRPSEVKTRLAAALGPERACEIYRAFLSDSIGLLRRVSAGGIRGAIAWWGEIPQSDPIAQEWQGLEMMAQEGDDLGQRMSRCLATLFARGHDRVVIIGADTPSLPVKILKTAFDLLRDRDLVLGPAADGGYYLLGARSVVPEIFRGIAWGSDRVLSETLAILKILGLPRVLLPEWRDVDTVEDLERLRAELADLAESDPTARSTRRALGRLQPGNPSQGAPGPPS